MKLLGYAIAAFASCSPMQDHVRLSTHSFVAMECSRSRRLFLKHQSSFLGGLTTLGLPWLMIDHTEAMTTDPKTGISLPSEGDIEASIPVDWNDADNPFGDDTPQTLFSRLDASPDSLFYAEPRFVEHVDAAAVQTLTDYISKEALHKGDCVLDLCSSWTSHINVNQATSLKRVAGLGMNAKELSANSALTDWIVRDLNQNPQLPYEDNSFDVVLCQLSIDYLTQPKQVLKEVSRVLKPGAMIHVLFSNRLFLSKAIGLWTGADDIDHAYIVGSYLHFCDAGFRDKGTRFVQTYRSRTAHCRRSSLRRDCTNIKTRQNPPGYLDPCSFTSWRSSGAP